MTISDAAKVYGLSERTIRRWVREGRLKARKKDGVTHVHHLAIELMAEYSRANRYKRSARPAPVACRLTTAPVSWLMFQKYVKGSRDSANCPGAWPDWMRVEHEKS